MTAATVPAESQNDKGPTSVRPVFAHLDAPPAHHPRRSSIREPAGLKPVGLAGQHGRFREYRVLRETLLRADRRPA